MVKKALQGITEISLNDHVYVRLTRHGKSTLRDYAVSHCPNEIDQEKAVKKFMAMYKVAKHKDCWGFLLHELMRIFDIAGSSQNPYFLSKFFLSEEAITKPKRKRIVILEGISMTGKTEVGFELERMCYQKDFKARFILEHDTLMGLLDNTDIETAKKRLMEELQENLLRDVDVLIFDRFHLTHMFRTGPHKNAMKEVFAEIETLLKKHATQICLLEFPLDQLDERFVQTKEQRDEGWYNYLTRKHRSCEEVKKYYTEQHQTLRELLKGSSLTTSIHDTGSKNFREVAQTIFKTLKLS
jgi:thymidylate kinase